MKVFLVHCPSRVRHEDGHTSYFIMIAPMGLFAMADYLERAGHEVEILHLGIECKLAPGFDLAAEVEKAGVGLVGFALHWHYQMPWVLEEAARLKERLGEKVHVTLGGITATGFYRDLLGEPGVDSVCRGDGEGPLLALAEALEANKGFEEAPNLAWKSGEVRVNPLTYVASEEALGELVYHRLEKMRHHEYYTTRWAYYDEREDSRPVAADLRSQFLPVGRGCSINCADCGGSHEMFAEHFGRDRVSMRPLEAVAADVRGFMERGVADVTILFEPPLVARSRSYYPKLFRKLREEGLKPGVQFFCWFTMPDADMVEEMAATVDLAVSKLWFGVISFVQRNRRRHGSVGYAHEELEARLAQAKQLGLATGLVWQLSALDSLEDTLEGVRLALALREQFWLDLNPTLNEIDPNSRFWTQGERYGLKVTRNSYQALRERHRRSGIGERGVVQDMGFEFPDARIRWLLVQAIFDPIREAVAFVLTGKGSTARPVRVTQAEALKGLSAEVFEETADWVVQGVRTLEEALAAAEILAAHPGVASLSFADPAAKSGRYSTPFVVGEQVQGAGVPPVTVEGLDLCRFEAAPCPLPMEQRLIVDRGVQRGCVACPAMPVGEYQALLDQRRREVWARRGCEACPAEAVCSQCLFLGPVTEKAFCEGQVAKVRGRG